MIFSDDEVLAHRLRRRLVVIEGLVQDEHSGRYLAAFDAENDREMRIPLPFGVDIEIFADRAIGGR